MAHDPTASSSGSRVQGAGGFGALQPTLLRCTQSIPISHGNFLILPAFQNVVIRNHKLERERPFPDVQVAAK